MEFSPHARCHIFLRLQAIFLLEFDGLLRPADLVVVLERLESAYASGYNERSNLKNLGAIRLVTS